MSTYARFLFILLLVGFSACSRSPAELNLVGPTMGTTYSVKIASPPAHLQAHEVRAVIDSKHPFDRVSEGFARLESKRARGKIVIEIG